MDLHGGNIYRIAREKGIKNILDYSANINPLGISEELKKEVANNWELFERYPDPHYVELRETLAHHNELDMEDIIVGNGATEVIFLYCKTLNPKKALIVMPTFAEYERALNTVGCQVDYFELDEKTDFVLETEKLREKLKGDYDLLVMCNPNNPTGKFIELQRMKEIVEIVKESNTKLLLDEAFIEFVEGDYKESTAKLNEKDVFIVRALTKFFAIPGVRLGFGICRDKELKEKIEAHREPWTVNTLAEISAKVLLGDNKYIKNSKAWIEEEKGYMYSELLKGSFIKPYKTETNFILVKLLGRITAKELRERMIDEGVVIRDASNFPFLGEKFIRLAIKGRNTNSLVIDKIVRVTNEAG